MYEITPNVEMVFVSVSCSRVFVTRPVHHKFHNADRTTLGASLCSETIHIAVRVPVKQRDALYLEEQTGARQRVAQNKIPLSKAL